MKRRIIAAGLVVAGLFLSLSTNAAALPGTPGSLAVLNRYGEWRHRDHQNVMVFTDGLARLFTLPLPALGMARCAGILALALLPPANRWPTRRTVGLAAPTRTLDSGCPLWRQR